MEKGEKKEPFFLLPTQNSHFLYITVFHSTLTGEEKYMQTPAEARCNAAKAGSVERKMSCAAGEGRLGGNSEKMCGKDGE